MKFTLPNADAIAGNLAAAKAAEAQGRLGDVDILCRKVLAQQPRNTEAMLLRGAVAFRTGQNALAEQLMRSVISLRPDCVEALLRLAQHLRTVRGQEEAIELCRRAVIAEPKNSDAYFTLGLCLIDRWRIPEAIAALEQVTELRPTYGLAYDLLGRALGLEGRNEEAAAALRQSVKLSPESPNSYVNLGQHLKRTGARDEAERSYDEASRVAWESASLMHELGQTHDALGNFDRAESALRRAIELDPSVGAPRHLLSEILQQSGRFDEASRQMNEAIASHPDDPSLYAGLVHGSKVTEADRRHIDAMERLLRGGAVSARARAQLHYALGKAHDDLKEYGEAMRHYHEANRVALPIAQWVFRDRQAHRDAVDSAISMFTRKFFAARKDWGSTTEEPVFIVGMPRSGTTLTEQIISSHPDVAAAGEVAYLGAHGPALINSKEPLEPAKLRDLAEGYLKRLRFVAHGERRITDKMPQNYMLCGLIHATFPNARIVHCRRNPIDTCLSIYVTPISIDFSHALPDIAFAYHEYQRLMAHWRKVLPSERFFELDYEELVTAPEPLEHQLIKFLGLDWNDAVLRHEANTRSINTASHWQARQPIHSGSVERWRRYEPWIGDLLREFPEEAGNGSLSNRTPTG